MGKDVAYLASHPEARRKGFLVSFCNARRSRHHLLNLVIVSAGGWGSCSTSRPVQQRGYL